MNKKFTAVLTCLAIAACATVFAACTPQNANTHAHTADTEVETSSVLLDDGIYTVKKCLECGEEIEKKRTDHYIAEGLTLNDSDLTKATVITAKGFENFNAIMTNSYTPSAPYTTKILAKAFSGKTVTLYGDIDISGYNWEPIHLGEAIESLTLDGNGHKIIGLTLDGHGVTDGDSRNLAGLIGLLETSFTIKNVTFESATLTTTSSWSGIVVGRQTSGKFTADNILFNKCSINGSIASYSIRLGTLIGHCNLRAGAASIDVRNCKVTQCTFKGYHNVCGLIGTLDGAQACEDRWVITGCVVRGNKFYIGNQYAKHVNPYTCDTSYLEREAMEEYITSRGNSQSNNEFSYEVTD